MDQKIFDFYWWENKFRYCLLAQKLFLFLNLSPDFPAIMNIEPTNICNLKCSFCPLFSNKRKKGMMSMILFKKIINQLAKEKKLKILWLHKDGEPLLHPQIDKMVAYAKKKNIAKKIEIYTNAVFLDKRMALKLIQAGLDSLVVSLDALNKEEFKKIKGKDVYEEISKNIDDFLEIRRKLNAKRPFLSIKMIDFGDKARVNYFRQQWRKKADYVLIQKPHNWEGSIKLKSVKKEPEKYPCNLPWLALAVFWDGRTTACCVNYKNNELIMGDLHKETIRQIWQKSKYQQLRQAHLDQNLSRFSVCRQCSFRYQLPAMTGWLKSLKNE